MKNEQIKMFVMESMDWGKEPMIHIRVRSHTGFEPATNEEATITEAEMLRASATDDPGSPIRAALIDLEERTLIPRGDLARMLGTAENSRTMGNFMNPRRASSYSGTPPEPKVKPEPKPEPRGGWAGFMDNLGKGILSSPKLPVARVVKGGKE